MSTFVSTFKYGSLNVIINVIICFAHNVYYHTKFGNLQVSISGFRSISHRLVRQVDITYDP